MRVVDGLKIYSHEEVLERCFGKKGTPTRDRFEFNSQMGVVGAEAKHLRKSKNLTKQQLGKKAGLHKAQISKIEKNAKNVSITTVIKVFKALDVELKFSIDMPE